MTSNLGGEYILENLPNKDELINKELHATFKPEFLNRIDEIVFFNSLGRDVVYQILDKIIKEMEDRLAGRNIKIKISDSAKEFIISNSYDESYGARPIRRYVAQNVETLIAMELINGEIVDNSEVLIDVQDNKIIIKK
jgi:ATP-dependent Clp protease ATP-binding subunit ClpB